MIFKEIFLKVVFLIVAKESQQPILSLNCCSEYISQILAGFCAVRIDLLHFLAECHTR